MTSRTHQMLSAVEVGAAVTEADGVGGRAVGRKQRHVLGANLRRTDEHTGRVNTTILAHLIVEHVTVFVTFNQTTRLGGVDADDAVEATDDAENERGAQRHSER